MRARWWWWSVIAGLATASLAQLWDARRLAEELGRREIEARAAGTAAQDAEQRAHAAEQQAQQATAREQAATARAQDLELQVVRLEAEVAAALANGQAVGEALAQQVESMQRARVERTSTAAMTDVPAPTGVIRCLDTLRECLVADGFTGVRFLSAREVGDGELRNLELLDVDPARGSSEVIVAERMTATLDRATGVLALRFTGGTRRGLGLRANLPAGGYEKRFAPVTGPTFEQRLPYLVRAVGVYPQAKDKAAPTPELDAATRATWIERVDTLLGTASTELRLRLASFHSLRDGSFRDAQLVGYAKGRTLQLTADCRELAIEIDQQAGIVSLLLRDGTLRGKGGESTIAKEGYRMLLSGVTPKAAADAMLGMVVQR